VEELVRGKSLVIVPDGPLGLLPFEALRDASGKFLIETHRIRYAPSMTALHLNRIWETKRRRPSRPLLGIGDPICTTTDPRLEGRPLSPRGRRTAESLGEELPRLVFAGQEVTDAGRVLRAPAEDLWTGRDATEIRLETASARNQLVEYRFLHIATHGLLGAGPGRPPALVLSLAGEEPVSGELKEDGLLTIGEVGALRLNADLVVLSGCRTGRGEISAGEGVTGLARAFMYAGTRGVICSLWSVDDAETARTMTGMYQRLTVDCETAVALREAKLKMIRAGWSPSRWAPFILIGN
jgi:CHAT domain-containing protein